MEYKFDMDKKELNFKKIIKGAFIWIVEILIVIFLAYLTIAFGVEKTVMFGDSMNETLQNGDKILINKLSYRLSKPKRFDVVVFKQSGKEHSYYNMKRVIGLPGESLEIVEGKVFVNESVLEEPFLLEPMINGGLADSRMILEENEYFVLGDSRNNSEDSRFANIGNIIRDDIVGKAWIRLKPFNFVSQLPIVAKVNDEVNDMETKESSGDGSS